MKRLKPKQRGLAALAILLVATSLAATVTGLVLKAQLQKYVGGWEDRLAIAVPFMLLHDDTDLRRMEQAKQRSQDEPKQPEQPTEPEKPAEPEQPTEPEKPDEPEKPQVPGVPTELPTVVPGAKYGEDESFFDDAPVHRRFPHGQLRLLCKTWQGKLLHRRWHECFPDVLRYRLGR